MSATGRRIRVLVVDDEKPICLLLHSRLQLAGFESHFCTSSEEALALLSQQQFDAIISDLNMPGPDGFDLLKAAHRELPYCAFLMATGANDVKTGIAAMKMGASDYLVKPFQLDAVVAGLERALAVKGLERELEYHRKHLEQMVDERTLQLQAAYDETLDALAAALDLRDNETAGHSRRVTLYSLEIAKTMECSIELSKQLTRAALLHDIGKIAIPDSILLKEGKLTPEETAVMQTHVRAGGALLGRITFLGQASEIVAAHHERFDGTGYPRGLKGDEIPLGARIFAVSDTFDAITSDRPYRRARSFAVASQVIREESGRQFDPDVVDAFLSISGHTWTTIRMQAAVIYLDVQRVVDDLKSQLGELSDRV